MQRSLLEQPVGIGRQVCVLLNFTPLSGGGGVPQQVHSSSQYSFGPQVVVPQPTRPASPGAASPGAASPGPAALPASGSLEPASVREGVVEEHATGTAAMASRRRQGSATRELINPISHGRAPRVDETSA